MCPLFIGDSAMRILVVTGSSGGHVFPALALMESLQGDDHQLLLVLPQKIRNNKIPVGSWKTEYMHSADLSFNSFSKFILGFYYFLQGAWENLRIIIRFKPDAVVGFGSLNTVALVFWAWMFRIKTIIHEQNVLPGRANRLLAKLVDKIAVSFDKTKRYLNVSSEKIILTGNPLRNDLIRIDKKAALDFLKFKEGKFNILITGGSQGSRKLNSVCFQALSSCQKNYFLQIIHITGVEDFNLLKDKYASMNLTSKVFDFFDSMQYAYSVADLVICRSGATTIAELQKYKIPAILIPYPFAYAHQLANAKVLEELGAAIIIEDKQLNAEKLKEQLIDFFDNPQKLENMCRAYEKIKYLDAVSMFAKEVLN